MADRKATVVLHSLSLEDPIVSRTLTFDTASDRVEIGRASKRENKNLAPTSHNALFDSRVMSRTHAVLCASLDKKLIYIRDPGSMHGTWLNKEKIPVNKDITLCDGDELTFGVEVVRAADSFPPLKVRCECRWSEIPKERVQKSQHQPSTNTYCVPDDDDDDEVEYLGDLPPAIDLTTDETSDSYDSSAESDSEDSQSVAEVSSPLTSPVQQPIDNSSSIGQDKPQKEKSSNEKVPNTEQPLATPRMTPPSVGYDSVDIDGDNQYYDEYFAHGSDEESNDEDEDWDVDAEGEDEDQGQEDQEDQESQAPEERHQEEKPLPVPSRVSFQLDDQVPKESTNHISNFVETGDTPKPNVPTEKWDAPRMVNIFTNYQNRLSSIQNAASVLPENKACSTIPQSFPQPQERSIQGTSSYVPVDRLQSSFANYEAPRLRYKPTEILPEHCSSLLPPIIQKQPPSIRYSLDTMPLQGSYPLNATYNDGPFATSQPIPRASSPSANSRTPKPDIVPFMDPLAPMMPRASCDTAHNMISTAQPSQSSIYGTSSAKPNSPKKRKASAIETDSVEDDHLNRAVSPLPETQETSNDYADLPNAELPDAQPQTIAAILNGDSFMLNGPDSQLTTVSVPENSNETKENEHPSKMIKSSHRGSVRSHAATAILGAVVGAVGTIAALASLPPDYFA
ncbi:hypothetical protein BDW74DRAFT_179501 [Aspergillus multicolor]|uniref:FHA domain protein n=1 Tax=Aspergillus multicolor TaxID=41759 RepID=UPI003CCCF221